MAKCLRCGAGNEWIEPVQREVAALSPEPTDEEVARELEAAAREVWISVPSSYDDNDPLVRRHAAALCALGRILARLEGRDSK